MTQRGFFLILASILMLAPLRAHAATSAGDFVKNASIANQFEIDSSRLALERTQNDDVKEFAQRMIDDHSKAGRDMEDAVAKSDVNKSAISNQLDAKHQDIMDELKNVSAADFDKSYLDAQLSAHNEAIALFRDYARNGKTAPLKTFAAKTLPVLEDHHDHVTKIIQAR